MSKSAIYTALTTSTDVTNGGIIPLGSTIRRFGCNLTQDGNVIETCGIGYYKVIAVATMAAESTTPITVSLQQDGVPVAGASSTITVSGTSDETVLTVIGIVRNKCECSSALTFVLTGADATVDNMAVIVEKM